jgi:thiosulfate dehydrogenase [quinone] large subunit
MNRSQTLWLFLLRITMGWLLFWAGITKVLNPNFSAAGYLEGAKTFTGFFHWLASPEMLPFTNFINEWGLTLIGLALMLGIGTRIAARLGAVLMILYYLPILDFPYPNAHAYIVDEHIIYAIALMLLDAFRAGRSYGYDASLSQRFPQLARLFR